VDISPHSTSDFRTFMSGFTVSKVRVSALPANIGGSLAYLYQASLPQQINLQCVILLL
jgi:hypothetical protein